MAEQLATSIFGLYTVKVSTLTMKAVFSSKILILIYQNTEHCTPNIHCHKNPALKFLLSSLTRRLFMFRSMIQ